MTGGICRRANWCGGRRAEAGREPSLLYTGGNLLLWQLLTYAGLRAAIPGELIAPAPCMGAAGSEFRASVT